MKQIYLARLLFITLSSFAADQPNRTSAIINSGAAQQPKLIDQILAPLNQPHELNNIIQEYMGPEYIHLQRLKANSTLRSRIIATVENCFNQNGSLFAQKQNSGEIEIWDINSGTKIKSLRGPGFLLRNDIAFSSDDTYLIDILNSEIQFWNLQNNGQTRGIKLLRPHIYAIGKKYIMMTQNNNHALLLIDIQSKQSHKIPAFFTLNFDPGRAGSVCFNADGALLAIATVRNNIIIWHIGSHSCTTHFLLPINNAVGQISFSPDSKWLAISYKELVEIYNIDTKKCIFRTRLCELPQIYSVAALSFSKDQRRLFIRTSGWIKSLDLQNKRLQSLVPFEEKSYFTKVALSTDHRYIAVGTSDHIDIYADPNSDASCPIVQNQKPQYTYRQIRDRTKCAIVIVGLLTSLDRDLIRSICMFLVAAKSIDLLLTKPEKAFVAGLFVLMLYCKQF